MRVSSASVATVPRIRRLPALLIVPALLATLAWSAGRLPYEDIHLVLAVLWVIGAGGYGLTRGPSPFAVVEGAPGALTVAERQLVVEIGASKRRVALETVTAGFVHPEHVSLSFADGSAVTARVTESEAEALLEACGLGVGQRAISIAVGGARLLFGRFALISFALATGLAVLALSMMTIVAWTMVLLERGLRVCLIALGVTAVTLAAALASRIAFRRSGHDRITIANDGLVTHTGESEDRVAYRDIGNLDAVGSEIRIRRLAHREPILLRAANAREASAIVERIRRTRERAIARPEVETALLRGGRAVETWRQELRELATGEYRAPFDRARLFSVVADAARLPGERVGAALALSNAPSDAERVRVREVTEGLADRKLRVAITRALDGEVDAEELAELEKDAR